MNTFRPVEIKDYYINRVARAMAQYFWKHIFEQIFTILESNSVFNAKDDLLNAIKNGKVYYKDGAFRAERFTNSISSTLEKMGAKFKHGAYYIDQSLIPIEYIQALGIVQAQTANKLLAIKQVLSTLFEEDVDLDQYLLTTVEQMFKSLEVDIVKSAEQQKVPIIELGIVTPKAKMPKAKKVESFWKDVDKQLDKLRKEKKQAKTPEEKSIIQDKINAITKDAFANAPQLDAQINEIELNSQSKKIAQDYTYNMKYWVKKWEVKNITKMREDVVAMVQRGARQPEIQKYFEQRWKKAGDKAKKIKDGMELANQEEIKEEYREEKEAKKTVKVKVKKKEIETE